MSPTPRRRATLASLAAELKVSRTTISNAYNRPDQLSPALREVAELRLKYPDESLSELGRRCTPPISKPTVSSRLGALARLADRLRGVQVSAKAVR